MNRRDRKSEGERNERVKEREMKDDQFSCNIKKCAHFYPIYLLRDQAAGVNKNTI